MTPADFEILRSLPVIGSVPFPVDLIFSCFVPLTPEKRNLTGRAEHKRRATNPKSDQGPDPKRQPPAGDPPKTRFRKFTLEVQLWNFFLTRLSVVAATTCTLFRSALRECYALGSLSEPWSPGALSLFGATCVRVEIQFPHFALGRHRIELTRLASPALFASSRVRTRADFGASNTSRPPAVSERSKYQRR